MDCIRKFINILIMNKVKIKNYGCPVGGTLCTELARLEHSALPEANHLFKLFLEWLSGQLDKIGCNESGEVAMHLLARSQGGVAILANTFQDEAFIHREVDMMCEYIETMAQINTTRS